MASGSTNRGLYRALAALYNGGSLPSTFYLALVTGATPPTPDTNTLGELTEIAAGNGYTTGGVAIAKNTTDFPNIAEVDGEDLAEIEVKSVTWTASGGNLPASGGAARYAVLTDANATVANREVWHYWDLLSDQLLANGQTLTMQGGKIRLTSIPSVQGDDLDGGEWTGKITATADAPSAALNDFWFIAQLDSSMSELWAGVRSDGGDLRVKINGVQVPCWVPPATWNYAGQAGLILFSRPGSSSAAPEIDIYFGNAAASAKAAGDQLGQYAVFPSTLRAFYLTGAGDDATSYGNNLTMAGTPTVGGVAGPLTGSLATDYDGSTQYGTATASVPTAAPWTMLASMNPDNTTANMAVMGVFDVGVATANNCYMEASGAAGDVVRGRTFQANNFSQGLSTGTYTAGAWHRAVSRFSNDSSRDAGLAGVMGTVETTQRIPANIDSIGIAAYRTNTVGGHFAGPLALIELYAADLPTEWIAYDNAMLADPDQSTFYNGWVYSAV